MMQWFKSVSCSISVLMLSFYTKAVLAVEGDPIHQTELGSKILPPQVNETDMLVGSLMMIGSLLFMIGLGWLLVVIVAKLFGSKAKLTKPLILGGIGIGMMIVGRSMLKQMIGT